MGKTLKDHWAWFLVILYLVCVTVLYAVAGPGEARFAVADNLDLFQAQYQMLKNTDSFFAHGVSAPFLHGVTRDDLPSELSLSSVLYMILPSYQAYIANYEVKVLLAVLSFCLLAKELDRRSLIRAGSAAERANLTVLAGFAYGLLNLFPAYGISFSSIPLIIWLLLRLDSAPWDPSVQGAPRRRMRRRFLLLYLGIFCYPFVSYFSYFGLFILGYMCIAWLWTSIARRKPSHRLFLAIAVLALGSMVFEYRLFSSMLFSDEVTIRSSMKIASLTGSQILDFMRDVLLDGGTMHTKSVQTYLVLPVCAVYFLILNIGYLVRGKWRGIFHDLYNLAVLILLFNTAVYGLYYWEPFRTAVETAIPQLKGWQFNRTVFFNPFLWYGMFYLAVARLADFMGRHVHGRRSQAIPADAGTSTPAGQIQLQAGRTRPVAEFNRTACHASGGILRLAAILVILLSATPDNDVYSTLHALAFRQRYGQEEDSLSYGEFYSTALFEKAKADIGYDHEWSAAYGFHPAVPEYNDIRTLDGYLGFYAQSYKEAFREVIAPALDRQPATAQYFDDWGARCYLYSGTEGTNVEAVRNYPHPAEELYINPQALKDLGCRYIFSRPEITNAEALGLTLRGTYTDESSPYVLHVYALD